MLKKLILCILIFVMLMPPYCLERVFAQSPSAQYLCELGIAFYRLGKYEDAQIEFKKALMLEPNNDTAHKYLNEIHKKQQAPLIVPEEKAPELKEAVVPQELLPVQSRPVQAAPVPVKGLAREEAMDLAFRQTSSQKEPSEKQEMLPPEEKAQEEKAQEDKIEIAGVRLSGEVQARLGFTPEDVIWKKAEWDLNEKNTRILSDDGLNSKENTFDSRIYQRVRLDLDAGKEEGFAFHSNIMVDPWSFTGKTAKQTVTSNFGDSADVEMRCWGNSGYTIRDTIYSTRLGNSFALPEVKVHNNYIEGFDVGGAFWPSDTFHIPGSKVYWTFQPVRELWLDYAQEGLSMRVFPFAYESQALTFDDPLVLSNNRIWWESSPWLNSWQPGMYNSGANPPDFSKGYWDNSIAFFARDSEGRRLTSLRGFNISFAPFDSTSVQTSIATPKDPWQEYSESDNFLSATRIKHEVTDALEVGFSGTTRLGYHKEEADNLDAWNYVVETDAAFEIADGIKVTAEIARSQLEYDLTNERYKTEEQGHAYQVGLMGRFPRQSLKGVTGGYNAIKQEKEDPWFTKFRFFFVRMDDSFEAPLSSYVETRDDEWWSRHLHFRTPFKHYYQGEGQTLTWDDVRAFAIGNGVDVGRSTAGLRVESALLDNKLENLFDVRNVHQSNGGKFIENVAREEITYKPVERLTTKLLGIYHRLPDSAARIDPFVFDSRTGYYFLNTEVEDDKQITMTTGSLGAEYKFFEWLAMHGIWEYTNDISFAYENFPRGLLHSGSRGFIYEEDGNRYREILNALYGQEHLPPYSYYNIWKAGLKINPLENLDIFLDYTRNEYEFAGQVDDNMNHVGIEVGYTPFSKLSLFFRYTYSRWQDLDQYAVGNTKVFGHHNVFTELIYRRSEDEDITFQYGEASRDPYMGGVLDIGWDPYGGSSRTIDTRHIFRLFYSRRF